MIIALLDAFNNCDFAFKFSGDVDAEQIEKIMREGLDIWYEATNEAPEPNKYFTSDEINSFEDCGYAEPAGEILNKLGIPHEDFDLLYNNDEQGGDPLNLESCDVVFSY